LKKLSKSYTILLSQTAFSEWGGRVGEKITIHTFKEEQSFEVVGVVNTLKLNGYIGFSSDIRFSDEFGINKTKNMLITYHTPNDEDQVKEQILSQLGSQLNKLNITKMQLIRAEKNAGQINIFYGLLLLAIPISGIGIVNTLLMNVIERTREIGVMHAIGFARSKIKKMILGEGLIIGVTGVLSGILLGFIILYFLTKVIDLELDSGFTIPWLKITIASCLGILLSLFTSLIPAMRATKIPLNESLKYEQMFLI
jgi:putative ABC transport system permease protein